MYDLIVWLSFLKMFIASVDLVSSLLYPVNVFSIASFTSFSLPLPFPERLIAYQ